MAVRGLAVAKRAVLLVPVVARQTKGLRFAGRSHALGQSSMAWAWVDTPSVGPSPWAEVARGGLPHLPELGSHRQRHRPSLYATWAAPDGWRRQATDAAVPSWQELLEPRLASQAQEGPSHLGLQRVVCLRNQSLAVDVSSLKKAILERSGHRLVGCYGLSHWNPLWLAPALIPYQPCLIEGADVREAGARFLVDQAVTHVGCWKRLQSLGSKEVAAEEPRGGALPENDWPHPDGLQPKPLAEDR